MNLERNRNSGAVPTAGPTPELRMGMTGVAGRSVVGKMVFPSQVVASAPVLLGACRHIENSGRDTERRDASASSGIERVLQQHRDVLNTNPYLEYARYPGLRCDVSRETARHGTAWRERDDTGRDPYRSSSHGASTSRLDTSLHPSMNIDLTAANSGIRERAHALTDPYPDGWDT